MLFVYMFVYMFVCMFVGTNSAEPTNDVRTTITALEDLISWAKAHHDYLILDFLFSLRMVQGDLEHLTERPGRVWEPELTIRLKLLAEKTNQLTDLAFQSYEGSQDLYYIKFKRLVNTKYYVTSYYCTRRTLKKIPVYEAAPPSTSFTFSETESDDCMVEILGTKEQEPCTFSSKCLLQMTNDKSEDYQLTHQLLFFILSQLRGCGEQLAVLAQRQHISIDDKIERYLSKMYSRLPSVLEQGHYDLFTEMLMVGQMLGYDEFYSPSLIQLIYLWQDTTGCYRDEAEQTDRVYTRTRTIGRRIFNDEILHGNCSEHFTAVSLICLSLILHHQLDDIPPHISPLYIVGVVVVILVLLYVVKCRRLRFMRSLVVSLI